MHGMQLTDATVVQQVTSSAASLSAFPSGMTKDKWVPKDYSHQSIPRVNATKWKGDLMTENLVGKQLEKMILFNCC